MVLSNLILVTTKHRLILAIALLFLPMSVRAKSRTFQKLLFICLILSFSVLKSQTSIYNISDPRNPQCPCHKYQKLADDEFKHLLRNGSIGVGEFVSTTNSREDDIHKRGGEKYRKYRHKTKGRSHRQARWIYELKNWDIWKRVTDPTKCYKW